MSSPPRLCQTNPLLSPKQIEVLEWLSKGKHYEDIAAITGVARPTIAARAKSVMDKLGANTSAGAVGIALRTGIIK